MRFDDYFKLGDAHQERREFQQAIEAYRQAIQLNPTHAIAHNALGTALHRAGSREEAMGEFEEAARLDPLLPAAFSNLGNVLLELGRPQESLAACQRAVKLKPDFPGAWNNLGNALMDLRRPREAIECFDRAIPMMTPPRASRVRVNKAFALLMLGELKAGFAEYEARAMPDPVKPPKQAVTPPRWNGEPVIGRTILLTSEQGYGDLIQFIRYAPLVAGARGRVVVACVPELRELFATVPGVALAPAPQDSPPVDVQCPILSLPHLFPADLDSIPAMVPYLFARRWARELQPDSRPRIGLAWASRPGANDAAKKSCPLEMLALFGQFTNVAFYSLQKTPRGFAASKPRSPAMIDLTEHFHTFADTAALMQHLDLIITIDTAVAHLAGAMGKEVWTMLPYGADWRWLIDRPDSPWYPTMRLFRQPAPGDWAGVIRAICDALASVCAYNSPQWHRILKAFKIS